MYLFVWIPLYDKKVRESLCDGGLNAQREDALEIERG